MSSKLAFSGLLLRLFEGAWHCSITSEMLVNERNIEFVMLSHLPSSFLFDRYHQFVGRMYEYCCCGLEPQNCPG